ncbi:MAG: hypothetical protein ACPGRX_04945 [Bdellovibrionales bacterium]
MKAFALVFKKLILFGEICMTVEEVSDLQRRLDDHYMIFDFVSVHDDAPTAFMIVSAFDSIRLSRDAIQEKIDDIESIQGRLTELGEQNIRVAKRFSVDPKQNARAILKAVFDDQCFHDGMNVLMGQYYDHGSSEQRQFIADWISTNRRVVEESGAVCPITGELALPVSMHDYIGALRAGHQQLIDGLEPDQRRTLQPLIDALVKVRDESIRVADQKLHIPIAALLGSLKEANEQILSEENRLEARRLNKKISCFLGLHTQQGQYSPENAMIAQAVHENVMNATQLCLDPETGEASFLYGGVHITASKIDARLEACDALAEKIRALDHTARVNVGSDVDYTQWRAQAAECLNSLRFEDSGLDQSCFTQDVRHDVVGILALMRDAPKRFLIEQVEQAGSKFVCFTTPQYDKSAVLNHEQLERLVQSFERLNFYFGYDYVEISEWKEFAQLCRSEVLAESGHLTSRFSEKPELESLSLSGVPDIHLPLVRFEEVFPNLSKLLFPCIEVGGPRRNLELV